MKKGDDSEGFVEPENKKYKPAKPGSSASSGLHRGPGSDHARGSSVPPRPSGPEATSTPDDEYSLFVGGFHRALPKALMEDHFRQFVQKKMSSKLRDMATPKYPMMEKSYLIVFPNSHELMNALDSLKDFNEQ